MDQAGEGEAVQWTLREQKVGAEVPVPPGPGRKPGSTLRCNQTQQARCSHGRRVAAFGEGLIVVQGAEGGVDTWK